MSSLTRIVPWSQQLVCEVLRPGDLAVDLTAGKGRDTFALATAVGSQGQVVAFDLQASAIRQAAVFLQKQGFVVHDWSGEQEVPEQSGIFLLERCHSRLNAFLQRPVRAIIANLGYLPGGDRSLVTHVDSTLAALQQSLELLAPGGRLAVTVYPAHPGGSDEGSAVSRLFSDLSSECWQVLSLNVSNCLEAPYLLVAERTS